MKKSIFAVLLASAAFLSGCGTVPGLADVGAMRTGTQVSDDAMSKFVDNKSTQADVVGVIGHPNRKNNAGQRVVWYYDFTQIGQSLIGRNISETTVFEFNTKGILVAHYKTGGQPGESSNPLLRAAGK